MHDDELDEAFEWRESTWTLDQVRDELERRFDVVLVRTSLRNLFVDLGIKPLFKTVSRESGRGVVGYYDPLVCWVAWVACNCVNADRGELSARLEVHRDAARHAVWGRLANTPKKRRAYDQAAWDWRVESTAYHLFISDLRHGPHPRDVHDLLSASPRAIYDTLDSNRCLECVLRVYVANYVERNTSVPLEPTKVNILGDIGPLFQGRIKTRDTLDVLDSFGVLRPGGPRITEPDHLYFDAPVSPDFEEVDG